MSSHELNQPGTYQDVTDTTITAQFECVKETLPERLKKYSQVYILAWTTTPWTLPSNTALTVGKKIKYALIRTFNLYTHKSINVILAKDLIPKVFKLISTKIGSKPIKIKEDISELQVNGGTNTFPPSG